MRKAEDLLAAKRDFDLSRQLRKLDHFDILLLDDLGYLPRSIRAIAYEISTSSLRRKPESIGQKLNESEI